MTLIRPSTTPPWSPFVSQSSSEAAPIAAIKSTTKYTADNTAKIPNKKAANPAHFLVCFNRLRFVIIIDHLQKFQVVVQMVSS